MMLAGNDDIAGVLREYAGDHSKPFSSFVKSEIAEDIWRRFVVYCREWRLRRWQALDLLDEYAKEKREEKLAGGHGEMPSSWVALIAAQRAKLANGNRNDWVRVRYIGSTVSEMF